MNREQLQKDQRVLENGVWATGAAVVLLSRRGAYYPGVAAPLKTAKKARFCGLTPGSPLRSQDADIS